MMASTGNGESGKPAVDAASGRQEPANEHAGKASPASGKPADAKAARLAAALRQNLQRRKAQARGRKSAADGK